MDKNEQMRDALNDAYLAIDWMHGNHVVTDIGVNAQMKIAAALKLIASQPVSADANNQSERDAEELYFLQDKRSYVGNCVSWWAKDGNGYTTRIDLAHRYTKEEAFAQHQCRETDIPWPCSVVEPLQRPTIDMQDLHKTGYFKAARADQEKA